ncbi:hypothetical protein [Nonomuraea sp. NPDC050310]|uniref:hypothetical protein n=1 Tax=unclassified Nonomuraea TaxID=2593643 RepID=UPI0033C3DE48
MSTRLIVSGALGLALLAGCAAAPSGTGGSAAPAPSITATTVNDKRREREAVIADCMKRKGFKYVAISTPRVQAEVSKRADNGDYEAMKEIRAKLGLQIFSVWVYPNELPGGQKVMPAEANPNVAIRDSLSAAQAESYDQAKEACFVTAVREVFGISVKSQLAYYELMDKETQRINAQVDGDARFVELAAAYAECLKGKGYPIRRTKPSELTSWVWEHFSPEYDALIAEYGDPKDPSKFPQVPPAVARPLLDKEIKVAMDDLECGKDFFAAFNPVYNGLYAVILDKYGLVRV